VAITGKGEDGEYLEGLGANEVLLRQELEMGRRPLESARWAGAVDTVGGKILGWITRTAKKDGRVAVCSNAAGTKLQTTVFPFILRGRGSARDRLRLVRHRDQARPLEADGPRW